jgi:hypothetical protein
MSTFDAGDHVKVQRPLYIHHGIYVNDCRVIDFSGGNLFRKPKAFPVGFFGDIDRLQLVRNVAKLLWAPSSLSPPSSVRSRTDSRSKQPYFE